MNLIQHFVGGELISGSSNKKGKVFDPAKGEQKSEVILANKSDFIEFADTWSAMVENGVLKKDIFIEDGLHLNEKGYEIWEKTLKKVFYK